MGYSPHMGLLEEAGDVLDAHLLEAWHEDWPHPRPSNWDAHPRIPEDPLDVPPWYLHKQGLFFSWRGYGYCRGCRTRIEAHTETEARTLLESHLCRKDTDYFQFRKQRRTKYSTEKKIKRTPAPKHILSIDVCGGCFEPFSDTTREGAAAKLERHITENPCPHYADQSAHE